MKIYPKCIHTHFSSFFPSSSSSTSPTSTSSDSHLMIVQSNVENFTKSTSARPVTKEELGRSTWTMLHTLAAQMSVGFRPAIFFFKPVPCCPCTFDWHFVNPVLAGSQAEFSQWLCHVHNIVNRSLGKLTFPCQWVDARWGKLDCKERA
ncbi:hypothetical protein MKX01_023634 [Papaver californicum]|nr:hypothetical protein MKX01_023634 [Papaver californicum]